MSEGVLCGESLQPIPAEASPYVVNGDNHIHYSRALPDFKWINGEVPILEVAKKLGLVVRGKKTTCPECGKRRLTFTTVHNGWKCWSCDPGGKMRSVIDLVMARRQCPPFEAAKWISENCEVVGRVQIEFSENARGEKRHTYQRYRPVPATDESRPSIEALVASPGWREMSLSARVVAMTLFGLARMDDKNSVTTNRRELSYLTGITDPNTLAKANREVQAVGLFEIDRGFRTKYAGRPTVYRLTWWSQVFQRWLKAGYAVTETATPTTPHHHGTSTSGGFFLPRVPADTAPVERNDSQPTPQAV
jgi:hypothetical protein